VVFLDPPYDTPAADVVAVLGALDRAGIVAPHGTVVIERPRSGEPVEVPDGWGVEKERTYGDTLLVVAHAG
jgi:16S rRNA (guanine966-N2)-methyltransferase